MRNLLEHFEQAFDSAKEFKKDLKRFKTLRKKEDEMDLSDRQRRKLSTDISYLAMHIRCSAYSLHCQLIKCGLSGYLEDEYYQDETVQPNGWQRYKHRREKPSIEDICENCEHAFVKCPDNNYRCSEGVSDDSADWTDLVSGDFGCKKWEKRKTLAEDKSDE